MSKLVVGQIGVGGYGRTIRRALAAADNITVRAVADADPEVGRQAAEELGAELRPVEAILADPAIAAVVLVLPNHLHLPFGEQAAAAGKHVFVEKPIANYSRDARTLIEACRASGVTLMIGHNYRREATYRQVKRWLDEGCLGTVIEAQGESSHDGGLRQVPGGWRFDPALCPALPLIQLGIHVIDLCNLCFGEPVEVTSLQRHRAIPGANHDATMTLIAYESDVLVSLASHYCTPGRTVLQVSGTAGRIVADARRAELRCGERHEVSLGGGIDTHLEQVREFAAAILSGGPVETPGEVGLRALAVCEAATLSARERRTVRLAELA